MLGPWRFFGAVSAVRVRLREVWQGLCGVGDQWCAHGLFNCRRLARYHLGWGAAPVVKACVLFESIF